MFSLLLLVLIEANKVAEVSVIGYFNSTVKHHGNANGCIRMCQFFTSLPLTFPFVFIKNECLLIVSIVDKESMARMSKVL